MPLYATVTRALFVGRKSAKSPFTLLNDRVVRVERNQLIGADWKFDQALSHFEDSATLNTSFIERLNLTIRQGTAHLN